MVVGQLTFEQKTEDFDVTIEASRDDLVVQQDHVCDDIFMMCLLLKDGLRVHCVPEDDLIVSANREHELPVVDREEFHNWFFMINHFLEVGTWLGQVPHLHNVLVSTSNVTGLELAQTRHWTSSSKGLDDLITSAFDLD